MFATSLAQRRAVVRSRQQITGAGVFFGLTFAWSWSAWAALAVMRVPAFSTPGLLLLLLGGIGPSLVGAALLLGVSGASERRSFLSRLVSFRHIPRRWTLVALLLPPVLTAAALWADLLTGGSSTSPLDALPKLVAKPGSLLSLVLQMLVGGALAEEIGWRGYALERIQSRFSPLAASLVLGLVWALWHAPLFLISGTAQAELGLVSTGALLFGVCVVAQSVLFTWIYNHTRRSILAAIVFHFTIDFSLTLFSGIGHAQTLSAMGRRTGLYVAAAVLVVLASARSWTTRQHDHVECLA
jgi:CAAX protease family protein